MNEKAVNRATSLGPCRAGLFVIAATFALAGCEGTMPSLGGSRSTVTGAAGGSTTEGANSQLEHCDQSLGTLAVVEDQRAPWYYQLGRHNLGSTVPVLRMMIQQSNCFVVVERGQAFNNTMQERALDRSGEMRQDSNFGKGQMVAADYTMSPSINFSQKGTGGAGAAGGGIVASVAAGFAGSVKSNEASTTLLMIDNRSGVQLAAAEGSAKNFDYGFLGAAFGSEGGGAAGGYTNTPQGKIIIAAFADSYNQIIKVVRNYKAQTVKGGLGTGGQLGVQGGTTPASKELNK